MPLLELKDVTTGYRGLPVLLGLSLCVEEGEAVALLGANGMGKTTTLRLISGLLHPWQGEVVWEGRWVGGFPPERMARLGIAHVPEGGGIFSSLTVEENLHLSLYSRKDPRGFWEDVEWVLGLFPPLRERYRATAGVLSGGERQMLAVARALLTRPRLLLLDEPSLGLAPILAKQLFSTLRQLVGKGIAILLVEQNLHLALELVQRAYILQGGRVVYSGTKEALQRNPEVRRFYLGVGRGGEGL